MIHILLLIVAFAFMELVAWSNHKFVMHGFLWKWHKDHHINDHKKANNALSYQSKLEKNDYFFLIYAVPALFLLIIGFWLGKTELIAIGTGISIYGITYFIIHDVVIHKRLKIPFLFKLEKNGYINAIIKAHMAHHRGKNIKDFDNYGLLVFQLRFFKT